jgi:4-diphosphocytidyl-2-C-methyl-D-erythritol kinase
MTIWPAPAKLNLFLHVVGRRADGYHLLQTVFQFLDYGDELEFEVTGDGHIARATGLPGVPEEADLTMRAAQLLQRHAGARQGATIRLRKRLPVGGGLGGGSSDAATTLIALNRLWGLGLPVSELAALGLRLGADVPGFVHGRAAWAEGVGEVLTPVEAPCSWYVVVVPPVQVATADIFADPHLTRDTPPITIRAFLAGRGHNDLEPVVRRRYPAVDQALRWLGGFGAARMTGSGACVFLAAADRDDAERILALAPAPLTGFVARGMNRHPLYMEEGERRGTRTGV